MRPDTRPAPILEAVNLTKQYEDSVVAVDHLNFAVYPGQIYAMLGANGAGKTTTINLFLNFIEPTSGEARVESTPSHRDPLSIRQKVAYVSENVILYPQFTALQNLDFFARLSGIPRTDPDYYREVLLRVGLETASHHRKLRDFSKGMRQKCGIAIAIIKNTPAILLDEPTSGLDPKAGHEFLSLLASLRDEGRAILMSTHDIFRAKALADRIGFMKAGKLVAEKTAEETNKENLETLYLHYMEGESDDRLH